MAFFATLRALPWARIRAYVALAAALAVFAGLSLALLGRLAWQHRQRGLRALVHAIAALVVAAEAAYWAGGQLRHWVQQLADASATLSATAPGPLAPIIGGAAATLEALRLLLVRFLARHYRWRAA